MNIIVKIQLAYTKITNAGKEKKQLQVQYQPYVYTEHQRYSLASNISAKNF